MNDPNSLTGVWDGVFSYPAMFPPTTFTAVMFEAGSTVSGTTHELSSHASSAGQTLHAVLEGARIGAGVSFTKTYETDGAAHHRPVRYVGQVNVDMTEIEGSWTIQGDWSGRFLMVRSGRHARAVKDRARQSLPVS